MVVDSKSNDITDSNKTEKESAIEFLENRGFKLEQSDEGFEIRITHRIGRRRSERNICRIRRVAGSKKVG